MVRSVKIAIDFPLGNFAQVGPPARRKFPIRQTRICVKVKMAASVPITTPLQPVGAQFQERIVTDGELIQMDSLQRPPGLERSFEIRRLIGCAGLVKRTKVSVRAGQAAEAQDGEQWRSILCLSTDGITDLLPLHDVVRRGGLPSCEALRFFGEFRDETRRLVRSRIGPRSE